MTHSQQIALFLTAIFSFLVCLLLCLTSLSWPGDQVWPPEPQPYIEMAQNEEFIEPIELPQPTKTPGEADAPALTEEDLDNPAELAPESGIARQTQGEVSKPANTVSSNRPSDLKVTSKPTEQSGANEDNERREREAAARRTNNQTANAFAQSQSKNNANNLTGDRGRAGRRTGKADSSGPAKSKATGSGNHIGGGFGWPALTPNINSQQLGTLTIEFTINPDGSATNARYKAASTAFPQELIKQCCQYVESLQFPFKGTERPTSPTPGNTLVFKFEN